MYPAAFEYHSPTTLKKDDPEAWYTSMRETIYEVLYGDTLIGSRLPNLTYMLSFPDLAEMNAKWDAFRSDPEWKKLSSSPKYSFESIVTNISNLVLSPTSFSQI